MIIDCVSDLHGHYPKLEGGDLLIIAGDLTANNSLKQINSFKDFICFSASYLYKKVIMIAGNHDNWIQNGEFFNRDKDSWDHPSHSYLEDSGTEFTYHIDGLPEEDEGFLPSGKRTLKIWGSPWTKRFEGMNPHCMAFTVDTDEKLAEKWEMIPNNTDILVTHGPPYDFGDHIKTEWNDHLPVGSESLYWKVTEICSKLHIFGHIHEGYGIESRDYFPNVGQKTIIYINASHVNERYQPVNKPIRVEL